MMNLVELVADGDEQVQAPCKWGNIVVGHACYCHNDAWKEGPRKCPIYRNFGLEPAAWHQREWDTVRLPMFKGVENGEAIVQEEDRPSMPDDDVGGCPKFEPHSQGIANDR